MTWSFVVELETITRVANLGESTSELMPSNFGCNALLVGLAFVILRVGRVGGQNVFDVHQQQFLMLLLVVESENHEVVNV